MHERSLRDEVDAMQHLYKHDGDSFRIVPWGAASEWLTWPVGSPDHVLLRRVRACGVICASNSVVAE